ncbi:ATP-binding protein [Myxosarcina sp. GI1(2024)]
MIAIPIPWNRNKWSTMSFASTLYLCPILDLLLANVPLEWRAELRLGLQEALVNAAKHGNELDPNKMVIVKFTVTTSEYCWIIADEGRGFTPKKNNTIKDSDSCNFEDYLLPEDEAESGRGLCILHKVFDRVHWNRQGTQLTLSKIVTSHKSKQPAIH